MSGIIEMRDGYGWALGGATYKANENGVYIEMDNSTDKPVKTIYVDAQAIAPVYIFWQCRVYNPDTTDTTFAVTITGLKSTSSITTEDISVVAGGSTLFTCEGYATGDVTCEFVPDGTVELNIYIDSEGGV